MKIQISLFQAQRKDVINILFDEINKINSEIIFFGYELKEFEEKKDYVSIKFNNDKIEGSLIIGCDGINSKVGASFKPNCNK